MLLRFQPRGFRGLALDPPAAALGTALLRQVCLLWAGRGAALCNRRGWARCWETVWVLLGAATVGTDPPGVSLGTSAGTWGAASIWNGGCHRVLGAGEGCTLQAAKQRAMSPTGAPALSWHYGRF